MKTANINLYLFHELNKDAQRKAINEHKDFLDNTPEESENEAGEMESEYVEHSDIDTIESIEANEYLFYFDGSLAHITQYTGGHEKTGTTEFHFHGTTQII